MKIGILTIHTAHNYGSVLQAFALQEILKKTGNDVEIINYRPYYISKNYKYFETFNFSLNFKDWIRFFLIPILKTKRYLGFRTFMKMRFNYSGKPFFRLKKFPLKYDIYVLGSDQIWNDEIIERDPLFFGFIPCSYKPKVISYAASMDAAPLSKSQNFYFQKALLNFDSISVRESEVAKLISPLTTKKITVVLDPTLLVAQVAFQKIECKKNQSANYGSYILIYSILDDNRLYELAEKIAQKKKAKILILSAFPSFRIKEKYKTLNNVIPSEFLALIRDAECVITTSFHGTAFSIIYKKDYYTIPMKKQGCRIHNLLSSLGMENRIINNVDNLNYDLINYDEVYSKLEKLRQLSTEYLQQALTNS